MFAKKQKPFIILYLVHFLYCFLLYWNFLHVHYSVDAYSVLMSVTKSSNVYLQNGRLLYYPVNCFLNAHNVNLVENAKYVIGAYMLISTLCATLLALYVRRFAKDRLTFLVLDLGILLSFHNIFIAEWYEFTECMVMYMLAISAMTLAVFCTMQMLEKKSILLGIAAFLFLNMAYNSYQVVLPLYFILCVALVLLRTGAKLCKEAILHMALAVFFCAGSFLVNFGIMAILLNKGIVTSSRYNNLSLSSLWSNCCYAVENLELVWIRGGGLIDSYALPATLFALLLLCILSFLLQKEKILNGLYVIVIFAGCILAAYLQIILTQIQGTTPRTMVAMFGLYTLLVLLIACKGRVWIKQAACLVLGLFYLFTMMTTNTYSADLLRSNGMDKEWAMEVYLQIVNYESGTGIAIEHVAFSTDAYETLRWDLTGDYSHGVLTKAITVSWADTQLLNYYTGRSFTEVDTTDAMKNYYWNCNWEYFASNGQLNFDGDTVYIAIW